MNKSVLIIAAHPDDEVLAMAGTIAKLSSENYKVHILFMTNGEGARGEGRDDFSLLRVESARKAADILGVNTDNLYFSNFPDNKMDTVPLLDVIKVIERLALAIHPEYVFTHFCNDLNIDHRITHQAVMTAFRPNVNDDIKAIFEFYVPSASEWNSGQQFEHNIVVEIEEYYDKKLLALNCYKVELRDAPHPRSIECISSLDYVNGSIYGKNRAEVFRLIRATDLLF